MHHCHNQERYLDNLRRVNEQAGVDRQTVDIIVAFARIKVERQQIIDFYPEFTPQNDPVIKKFLEKNRHLDRRTGRFLAAYFHEMHKRGLCCILNVSHLANLLDITPSQLNRLALDIDTHYQQFHIPKRNGHMRRIDSPRPQLKKIQRKILDTILHPVRLNAHAEGFVRRKSIVTNARRHVGKEIVLKMDLSNFFLPLRFPAWWVLLRHSDILTMWPGCSAN